MNSLILHGELVTEVGFPSFAQLGHGFYGITSKRYYDICLTYTLILQMDSGTESYAPFSSYKNY